jgi:hypothetical protein
LSAGTTSNNLQTNSYTLRIRQAWAQAEIEKNIFTGGQMWTLLTVEVFGYAHPLAASCIGALPLWMFGFCSVDDISADALGDHSMSS